MSKDLRERLRAELSQRFPYQGQLPQGDFAYEGGLIELLPVADALAPWLPDYHFYRTQLTTGYLEYTFVEIIAAIAEQEQPDARILFSPIFRPNSPQFFELFVGLQLAETADRIHLSETIATMLATLIFEGSAKAIAFSNGRHTYNLYRQGNLEYDVNFDFTEQGVLTAVQVTKAATGK